MEQFAQPVQLRWSDLDPNQHVRHSVYYDWAASARLLFLSQNGISTAMMKELGIGPILFREEAVFRREIRMEDQLEIRIELTRSRRDYSRWTIRHELYKAGEILCATITVDIAWLNLHTRKLAAPPSTITDIFPKMPQSADFAWTD
ncbi:MAG: acyl-CoA thioesterase [Chitinophagaceae bacterium]|nr:MAG: acyl-CoA thioesterase [Chitinophagaceae bacterium]